MQLSPGKVMSIVQVIQYILFVTKKMKEKL